MDILVLPQPTAKTARAERVFRVSTHIYTHRGIQNGDQLIGIRCDENDDQLTIVRYGRKFYLGLVSIVDCARIRVRYQGKSIILRSDRAQMYRIQRVALRVAASIAPLIELLL